MPSSSGQRLRAGGCFGVAEDEVHTLTLLDATLKRYLALCAAYHEQYLQSPLQLEHACNMIVESELFAFHSERMCEIMSEEARSNTDPHSQLIFYHVLLCHGRRRADFFRSNKRWVPLLPFLMDHVLVDIDSEVEDTCFGNAGASNSHSATVPIPIEAKLRGIFDDPSIDYMFDLVEQTRQMQDETLNYSVIKLLVALNEQSLTNEPDANSPAPAPSEPKNRVLRVLMRRWGSTKTFGENMIFMLNRAQRTPEDLCLQLLVLKILYLLFTTKGTSEYFYTNDLCVLVDVFLRELVDLDDESESLRHTYLRVLHPLLTKTQLRDILYKRPQIVFALESLTGNSRIRDVSSTTRRLVDRCLTGDWCVQLRKQPGSAHRADPTSDDDTRRSARQICTWENADVEKQQEPRVPERYSATPPSPTRSTLDTVRRSSNASSINLVAGATVPMSHNLPFPTRRGSVITVDESFQAEQQHQHRAPHHSYNSEPSYSPPSLSHLVPAAIVSSLSTSSLPSTSTSPTDSVHLHVQPPTPQRRSAPPPPPAIPLGRTNGGATITTIRSSNTVSSPLAKTKF
ncbi:hypothetical protein C8F04DRAFT_1357990 [Mycena alexandri]|uniref:SPIN90/Ldb17 leucine-rich domain-containing protein n=1 Tax=Mycena alexandri TaxID=1745969 RepID=A0AAD6SVF1_9AGAR|nr:hypothetical protein C8F04DRAFT_1357990 [Mycena alexandri]